MDNVERGKDKPYFEVTDNSIAYVGNPTNSPRKVWVRNNGDPRNYSKFNKESRLNNNRTTITTTIALQTKRRENMP